MEGGGDGGRCVGGGGEVKGGGGTKREKAEPGG